MAVIRSAKVNYAEMVERITPFNEALHYQAVTGLWHVDSVLGLAAISREVGRQAQMIGYGNAFYLYTVISFATVPFLLLVKIRKEMGVTKKHKKAGRTGKSDRIAQPRKRTRRRTVAV